MKRRLWNPCTVLPGSYGLSSSHGFGRISFAAVSGFALALALTHGTATAGQPCHPHTLSAVNAQRALELAQRTRQALDASGASVVMLARAGQDLSRHGLRWSHLGWAYKADNTWRVVHKLNQCGTARADVYRQGLGEFFLDDLYRYEAAFAAPTPQVQARLLPLLNDNLQVVRLHTPRYSMVAYPWAQQYQQSNQWALETLAFSEAAQADRRDRAQAWLRLMGYRPTVLHVTAMTRLGAQVGMAHVAFDDHPFSKRFADRIETITVDSVFVWLSSSGLGGGVVVVP